MVNGRGQEREYIHHTSHQKIMLMKLRLTAIVLSLMPLALLSPTVLSLMPLELLFAKCLTLSGPISIYPGRDPRTIMQLRSQRSVHG